MASGRIKGITIEIDGNTTKLTESLKQTDKSLSQTQKELKDVNKLLKFDPKNSELLKQKQQLLAKAISDTKDKLKQQKQAYEQLKNSSDGTQKNAEQMRALEREIIDTENSLKGLEKQAKTTGDEFSRKMNEVGDRITAVGDKVASVGESMTKNVTAPIVAVGTASLGAFSQVDKGLDIIVKKTGATGDALEGFESIAKDIASELPMSFELVGESVGEVNTRFGLTGDELQTLSEDFLRFAKINDTTVTQSVDSVQKALSAYGLSGSDASHVLDVLTATAQATGISTDKLTQGLIQNGTAFQEMGLSIDQSVQLMGQMEKSGANSETVMNGLRKALKNATDSGVPFSQALVDMQNAIVNGTDSMDGLSVAYDMFGKSGDQIYSAIRNGTIDFTSFGDAVANVDGTVTNTFNNTISPMEQFQTAVNQLMVLGYEIGNAIMPLIQQALQQIIPVIQSVTNMWNGLSQGQQENIIKIVGLIAIIGPLLTIIGKVIATVGTAVKIFGALKTAFLFLTGPIGLVVGAVGGMIAVGVLLYKNWDTVKAKASQLWTSISNTFNNIKNTIANAINSAKNTVQSAINAIKGFFNFKVSFPHIKLPHFSVSGSANPLDWLKQGVPRISVSWYKKAYDNAVMFTHPTVIPTANGLKGFGDGNGSELVIGTNKLMNMIKHASSGVNVNVNVDHISNDMDLNKVADVIGNRIAKQIMRTQGI